MLTTTLFCRDLLPDTPADKAYSVQSYGTKLQRNKASLVAAFQCGTPTHCSMLSLMMAMAMVETTTLSVSDRDCSKDGSTNRSANCSLFNLSEDLLTHIGFSGRFEDLNVASNLPMVVEQIKRGVRKLGVKGFLNFVRGGRTGFLDGVSYGVKEYRSTIATILSVMDQQPALLTDDRRVDINLQHV